MSNLPPGWGANQAPAFNTKLPLATQLFPVADMLAKDLKGTLRQVKAAGYDGVEFAGGLGRPAQEVKLALDEIGLQIAGWHTPWHHLSPENIYATITYNQVLGNQFIIVPWMPDETLFTREACLNFAKQLTWVADVLAMHGMVTGYHNHATEFRLTDDTKEIPWEIIAENTPSTVIMQNDIGNGMSGGGDMMGLLKKYPGRGVTVHVKPFAKGVDDIFFDDAACEIDWDEYFQVGRDIAGVRWYIIEYMNNVRHPGDPMAGLVEAAKWFRKHEAK